MHAVPLGEVVDRTLGGGISRYLGQRAYRIHAGDIQDVPALAVRYHVLCKYHRSQDSTLEIEVEDVLEAFEVEAVERVRDRSVLVHLLGGAGSLRRITSGAVDEDVYASEFGMHPLICCLKCLSVEGTGGNAYAFDAVFRGDIRSLGIRPGLAGDHGGIDACCCKPAGESGPDDAEPSGDDAVASLEIVE